MLQMVRHTIIGAIAMLVISGCEQMNIKGFFVPNGDGVQKRFEQSVQMTGSQAVQGVETQDAYTVYVCTDPHISDSSRNLSKFNDDFRNDPEATFGIVLGDCIDKKDKFNDYISATTYNPDRHAYNRNIYHLLGNHDTYFNGWEQFRELIGPSVYWFDVKFPSGQDLYIALDTASGTLGGKQMEWLRSFLDSERSKYRHCFILSHTHLIYSDNTQGISGNMPIEETFALLELFDRQKVTVVLQGHDHYRDDLFYGNVRYTVIGSIEDKARAPEYLKITVKEDGISYIWVTPLA